MNSLVALTQRISQLSVRGQVLSARKIFDQMSVRDSVCWNVMIRCYVENKMVEDARELFDKMPERTSVSWNTMITGYIKMERVHVALKLFVVMPHKDVVAWTAMVTGLCRVPMVDEAWRLFKQMPHANPVSWSSMVSGFQQQGFPIQSLLAFREMLSAGIQPTSHSFTNTLSACADLAMASLSEQVYCQLLKRGFHHNTHVRNSAISMFVKAGSFNYARAIFMDMDQPDRVSWNAMITGFAQHGYGLEAIMTFHQMQKARVSPDSISYMGVLQGCSHCGLVHEGRRYFLSMEKDHGILPGVEHFSSMLDIYARAGQIEEAYEVILDMPFEPTAVFWRTLLSGCRIWGHVELGVHAAEQILKLEPYSSSACAMVINILSLAGKWEAVAEMRRRMRETEARKESGFSWIDIKGRNFLFTTGDTSHLEGDQILWMVELNAYDIARYNLRLDEFLDGLD